MQTHLRFLTILSCAVLTLAASPVVNAADEKKLPDGKSVLTPGTDGHRLNSGPNAEGEFKTIDVEGQPFKKAIRATVKKRPADVWHVQISTLLAQPVKRGDVVLISFHVRGKSTFNVYFGTPETELELTFAEELSAGEKWKHVQIPATVAADYEAGKGMLNLDLGHDPQTVEIADIKLINYERKAKESELPQSGR